MIIQFCGLPGAGKTTIATRVKDVLESKNRPVEVIRNDHYRESLCRDLGFSRQDNTECSTRMAFVAARLSSHNIVSIIDDTNPYEEARKQVLAIYPDTKLIHIDCSSKVLQKRNAGVVPRKNAQGLSYEDRIDDHFDVPTGPDLYIDTSVQSIEESAFKVIDFIEKHF